MRPPALLLIDLQRALDHPVWRVDGPRNHPQAEGRAAALLAFWRGRRWPVAHIAHRSVIAGSSYAPDAPGAAFKPEVAPAPGEWLIDKTVNSPFVDPDLATRLRGDGITALVVAGAITNNSVETTVRHASVLGFSVTLVHDACFTFAKRDYAGNLRSAEAVHALSVANLDGEYARVLTADQVLAWDDLA